MVRFEEVALSYGSGPEVLRDVDFSLDPGSFHFVTGPSGAGKSSLLRLLFLAQRPTRGRVLLFGRDAGSLPRDERALLRRRMGMVFQEFRLLDHLTVRENVALPLRLARQPEAETARRVEEILSWVGLAQQAEALPRTLSGGQQQRAAVARAVIGGPSLLLADEPTGNLDEAMARRLMFLFEELNKVGTTVVLATHNEALVERLGHPVLRLEGGRVLLREGNRGPRPPA